MTLQDTVLVGGLAAGGGGGGGSFPNEPGGAILLKSWDAALGSIVGTFPETDSQPFFDVTGAGNLATVTDATDPFSPSVVGRIRYPAGCCNGTSTATYSSLAKFIPPSSWQKYYVSYWWKNDSVWRNLNIELKQVDIFINDNTWIVGHDGDQAPWHPHHRQGGSGKIIDTATDLPHSTWHQYELLLEKVSGNTMRHRVFVNAAQRLDDQFTWTGTTLQQLTFSWLYGGSGSTTPHQMDTFFNHLYASYTT